MKNILKTIKIKFLTRYHCQGGYRELFKIALPLIASTASWSVLHFVDRTFLTWYSNEAIAAVLPAGMVNFTIVSFFMGTASYVGTFVAQYFGAKQYKSIGPAIWQSIYISLIGGTFLFLLVFAANPIFNFIGHNPIVRANEVIYFKIICGGSFFVIASSALSGFFSGKGNPWPIMWINLTATLINIILDYFFIFGFGFIPEMGIKGAAIATVIAAGVSLFIYIIILFRPKYNKKYHTLQKWQFNKKIFLRILKFGIPSGIHFAMDMATFTIFILLVGKIGIFELAATNITFNITTISFMPMIGFGMAIMIMVGQYQGAQKPELAAKSTYSGFHIAAIYMCTIAFFYILIPEFFLLPFESGAKNTQDFLKIKKIVINLLKFVAIFTIGDAMNILFGSAIKGAGDTKFAMLILALTSLIFLILPSYLIFIVFKSSIYYGWMIATIYILLLGLIYFLRFKQGKWKKMSVIETVPEIPVQMAENPIIK